MRRFGLILPAMAKTLSPDAVRAMLRQEVGDSQSAWAARHDISPAYVSDVINGRRDPAGKILRALGLTKTVGYERVEP